MARCGKPHKRRESFVRKDLIMENKKITLFNAMETLKELVKGQENLEKAIEEIATTVAVNNCATRLEELKKADRMREEVINYLIEIGCEKDFIKIPLETLKEWKIFLEGTCNGKPVNISGYPRFGDVKLHNHSWGYTVSMV